MSGRQGCFGIASPSTFNPWRRCEEQLSHHPLHIPAIPAPAPPSRAQRMAQRDPRGLGPLCLLAMRRVGDTNTFALENKSNQKACVSLQRDTGLMRCYLANSCCAGGGRVQKALRRGGVSHLRVSLTSSRVLACGCDSFVLPALGVCKLVHP